MLDVMLDCFGALLLFGQAAWILAEGEIEALPNRPPAVQATGDRPDV